MLISFQPFLGVHCLLVYVFTPAMINCLFCRHLGARRAVGQPIICPLDRATRLPHVSLGCSPFSSRSRWMLRASARTDAESCAFMTIVTATSPPSPPSSSGFICHVRSAFIPRDKPHAHYGLRRSAAHTSKQAPPEHTQESLHASGFPPSPNPHLPVIPPQGSVSHVLWLPWRRGLRDWRRQRAWWETLNSLCVPLFARERIRGDINSCSYTKGVFCVLVKWPTTGTPPSCSHLFLTLWEKGKASVVRILFLRGSSSSCSHTH